MTARLSNPDMRSRVVGLALVAVACGANRIPVAAAPHVRAPSQVHSSEPEIVAMARPVLDHAALSRASCERKSTGALPVAAARDGSSSVAIAYAGDDALAYVADADSRAIHTVTLSGKKLSRTDLDGSPRHVIVLGDGRLVATLSDAASLTVLEPASDAKEPMTVLCERALPAEPWAMAVKDESQLLVTSAFGAALSVIDLATFATRRTVALPRDPRSVLVDGTRAFVSHSVGAKLSVVDLSSNAAPTEIALGMRKRVETPDPTEKSVIRTASHGFALARVGRRLLLPITSVAPGIFDPEVTSRSYYGQLPDGVPKQAPTVMVIDSATRAPLSKDILGTTTAQYTRECLLPRAATVVSETTLFVACAGIDAVLELDAAAVDPIRAERARFKVPPDPEGLAVDARGKRLVVFSQIGATLTILPIGSNAERTTIALDYEPTPALAAIARGRQLFFRTDDSRIASDGVGCASCHIDGRDDGVTWATPIGPRQTPMLVGRVTGTAPFGWEGDRATLSDYIFHTVINLGGEGLPDGDRADLAAYLEHAAAPFRPAATPDARGAALFASSGCTNCHAGGSMDGDKHPFGVVHGDSLSDGTNTPTLRFVAGTAPYFHDGRYATIESLLADKRSHMGTSASLSDGDRRTLASYLRSL